MMVSETEEWVSFYEQLLIKNGFAPLYAVNFLIVELVIPSWAISVFLVCHYIYLLYQWIVKPVIVGWCTKQLLIFSVGWYVVVLPTLWIYASPRKQLLVYYYLAQIIPTYLARTWVYLQIDGSSQSDEALDWALARESLLLYSACSYVFTHQDVWWPTFGLVSSAVLILALRGRWRFFDFLLPRVLRGFSAGLLVEFIMRLVHTQSVIVSGFVFIACFNILNKYGNLDQIRVWEAQLFARLPDYTAHRWSRYQQGLLRRQKLPKFEYRPLGNNEIRLLILRPPRWFFGIIEANIAHQPIDPTPDYEAVSYCWGSPDRTDEILIDGCRFAVTRSAFDLLLARRSIWRYRTIWIDAICINQDNEREKSAQVQLMREIYHQATRVVIFTGSNWRARYGVPLILKIAAAPFQYGVNDWSSVEVFPHEKESPRWKVLYELFENLYFTRVWVIQEIAVGRKVELYYGGHYLEWDLLLNVYTFFLGPRRSTRLFGYGTSENRGWLPPETVETIEIIGLFRPDYGERRVSTDEDKFRPDWENVLFAANKFKSTLDKDKVFGLVGLATNINHVELLRPDYQKTAEQVYEDATRVVMFSTDGRPSIHLLALAGTGFSKKRKALPSWVPDFSESRPGVPYTYLLAPKRRFFASGMSSPVITAGPGPDSITLRGVVVDSVSALNASGPFEFNIQNGAVGATEEAFHSTARFFHSVVKLCNEHAGKWSAEDLVYERLWKVLIAGHMIYKRPDTCFKEVFRAWIKLLDLMDQDLEVTAKDESFKQDVLTFIADESLPSYLSAVSAAALGRRFGITNGGRLCLLPPFSQDGDLIFIPLGAQTPFIIREHPANQKLSSKRWEVVGEAFVEGLMDGEEMGKELEISLVFG